VIEQTSPFAGYRGHHRPRRMPGTVAQAADAGMDTWELPGEHDDTSRILPLAAWVRATAESPHVLYRPLAVDSDVILPYHSGLYRHRRTWAERRDDAAITVMVLVLWLLLCLSADRPRRPRLWGETWSAWDQRTNRTPAALEAAAKARVEAVDVDGGDDLAETDLTEANIDQMMADGVPVEIVAEPPAVEPEPELPNFAESLARYPAPEPIAAALHNGMTGYLEALTDERLAELAAEYARADAR
jgi:hypothetical protein